MALNQFQTIRVPDLGQGIDQESSPNHIAQGYSEDLVNADPAPAGHIEKRRGYQGYAGNIPVRVESVTQTGNELCFTLDSSIDLSAIRSSPIIVKGKVSNSTEGDFPSNAYTTNYYDRFEVELRKTFATGTHTDTISAAESGITTNLIWGGAAASDSLVNNANTQFFLDDFVADYPSHTVHYTYTNGTGAAFDGFVYLKGRTNTTGIVYNSPTTILTGTNTYTISSGTHNLNNHNILVKLFSDSGTAYTEILPDNVTIDDATGDVAVTVTNGTGSSISAVISLFSTDTTKFKTGNIGGMGTVSVTIDSTGESDFAFVGCYLKSGSSLEMVLPDSIVSDAASNTITVTFQNESSAGRVFSIFWDFASVVSNILCVNANNTAGTPISDSAPQLTIWGLDHSEIYGTSNTAREGWVNHIDSYRALSNDRLISGLGGNIFAAEGRDEFNNAIDHLMPLLYPRLSATLNTQNILGPAFWDTGETPARTRGYITGDNGGFNYFSVTQVAYDSGTDWVKYTLNVPNMVLNGTLSDIISTLTGMEDRLTTNQCGWAVHDGEFVVKQVTSGVDTLTIWVENGQVDSNDFDEPNCGGNAAIYTDRMTFTGSTIAPFLPDDILVSGLFTTDTNLVVLNSAVISSVPTILIDNLVTLTPLPAGLKVSAQRTSSIVPLRDILDTPTNTDVVRGDMLTYSEVDRLLRVKSVNVLNDATISDISGDGEHAVITLTGETTDTFNEGQAILIVGSVHYNGTFTISSILATNQLQVVSSLTEVGDSGTLVGMTVEVDELLTYTDTETSSNYFTVPARWIPIEAPTNSYNLPEQTRVRYFAANDYSDQAIIRSTMVQNNMYFTDGDNEVFKFDGSSIYRAGLFRWQPNLFLSTDTTTAGKIVMQNPAIAYTANAQNKYTIALADQSTFAVGDILQDTNDSLYYTVVRLDEDATNAYVFVDRTIGHSTASSTLTKTATFKYYFRLNAVDANENLIASAVAGADDFVARLGADASVRIRLLGMPAWDLYDYNRLDVQIYRTKSNSVAPFYRVTTLQMKFDNNNGYVDYIDTDSDDDLRDLDEVVSALKGQELGTAWQEPLRAKYVTSSDNKLILANVTDYPQLDLQILKNNNILTQSIFTNGSNSKWLFRLDSDDTATTTDMLNRVNYEFKSFNTSAGVTGATPISSTQFTITVNNTALAGDWVYFSRSGSAVNRNLRFSGLFQIASRTATTVTINNTNSDTSAYNSAKDVDRALFATTHGDVPVIIGEDYNYGMINGNRSTTEPYEFLAMRRLADAINASMRKVDTSITGFEDFRPWMIAAAGNEFQTGQLIVRQPRASTKIMEVKIPALSGDFDVYVNSVKLAGSGEADALIRRFPSRILVSYPNYPEIFDNPTASLDIDSDSAIDINSADGQEITAVLPFFGASAFGAALNSGVVVVFKTNSVYVVDLNAKAAGTTPVVQKLETRGNGCTAPYSVSLTKSGIIFANETGIYRITRNLELDYVGRKYERKWKKFLNKSLLDLATGTHDSDRNSYKLSYPVLEDSTNTTVAVYNHTREDTAVSGMSSGYGSWTTYDNHAATGWANLFADSYFSSTTGRVFSVRKLLDVTDFRDDSTAISMQVTIAATDFGDAGKRKFVRYVTTHYRSDADSVGTTLSTAVDLIDNFTDTDEFSIKVASNTNGLADTGNSKVVTLQSSLAASKCIYMQVRYENSTIDEPVIIAGIDYTVAGLTERGVSQAAGTR